MLLNLISLSFCVAEILIFFVLNLNLLVIMFKLLMLPCQMISFVLGVCSAMILNEPDLIMLCASGLIA